LSKLTLNPLNRKSVNTDYITSFQAHWYFSLLKQNVKTFAHFYSNFQLVKIKE